MRLSDILTIMKSIRSNSSPSLPELAGMEQFRMNKKRSSHPVLVLMFFRILRKHRKTGTSL